MLGDIDGAENESRYDTFKVATQRAQGRSGTTRDAPPLSIDRRFVSIAEFEYDLYAGWHIQTFPVKEHIQERGFDFGLLVLEVLSNWGGPETCLHRVRVHGTPLVV